MSRQFPVIIGYLLPITYTQMSRQFPVIMEYLSYLLPYADCTQVSFRDYCGVLRITLARHTGAGCLGLKARAGYEKKKFCGWF